MWDTYLTIAILAVNTLLYLVNYRILTPPLQILAINISITLAATLYAIYLWAILRGVNIHVYHILIIVQYALYGWLFVQANDQPLVKRVIKLSIGLFALISLAISFTIQPWNQYNSYAGTVFNLLIILLSGYYLWKTFVDGKVVALEREALFWVSIGLFFRSLGNFFADGLMNYLIRKSDSSDLAVYRIHEGMEFFLFSTFFYALIVYLRYLPSSPRR
ncbi:hypothetical protein GCM10028805_59100 [Spirosoma harenae]